MYTLKNSFNEYAFDDASRILVWITLGISLFHIYFPMEALNRKLLPIHQKACETKTFHEARLNFATVYFFPEEFEVLKFQYRIMI